MKQIYTILAVVLLTATTWAQSPQKMSYQAVVRDAGSHLVTNTQVGIEINIYRGSATGTQVYTETRTPTTNANGLLTIEIGGQTGFDTITWAKGPYFLETKIDPQGGTAYTITGVSQLLSVPYALHAKKAESITVYTTDEIGALTPAEGDALFNSTEKLYQIYNGTTWQSFDANCWPQPTVANAGTDQTFTDATTSTTLAANTPATQHGTGQWTIVSGTGGSFAVSTDPATTFTGTSHEAYILRWTISTACSNSSDDVSINFTENGQGPILTDIDGNSYNTVLIGNQLWMAENLKVTKEADGTAIPLVTDDTDWSILGDNSISKAYCYYSNSTDSLSKYGALYTYAAAEDACPVGWHLPTDAGWTELTTFIANDGHSSTEGTALKSTTGWNTNGNGTDDYGFSALPGGYRNGNNGTFIYVGTYGYWWSSSTEGSSYAYYRNLSDLSTVLFRDYNNKSSGFSVRCVKD